MSPFLVKSIAAAVTRFRDEGPPAMQTMHVPAGDLTLRPIDPSSIEQGCPVARCLTFAESESRDLWSGLWECSAGKFKWVYSGDEIVQILEGEVVVREEGTGVVHTLHAGDAAYFPAGLVAHWEIPSFVKKFFVLRVPRKSRLVTRLRRVARGVLLTGGPGP
jgi:uncharacterized cupin superfamily protein